MTITRCFLFFVRCVLYLTRYPEVQAAAREEVEQVIVKEYESDKCDENLRWWFKKSWWVISVTPIILMNQWQVTGEERPGVGHQLPYCQAVVQVRRLPPFCSNILGETFRRCICAIYQHLGGTAALLCCSHLPPSQNHEVLSWPQTHRNLWPCLENTRPVDLGNHKLPEDTIAMVNIVSYMQVIECIRIELIAELLHCMTIWVLPHLSSALRTQTTGKTPQPSSPKGSLRIRIVAAYICVFVFVYLYLCVWRFLEKTDSGSRRLIKKERFVPYGFGRRVCLGESLAKDTLRIFFATLVKHIRCWKSLIYFLLVIFNQPGKVYRPCESSITGPRKLHRDLNSYPRCLSRKYRTDQACLKQVIRFML